MFPGKFVLLFICFLDITYCCDDGWTLYPRLRHCYRLFKQPVTWRAARVSCTSSKSSLVILLDSEEQRFISATFLIKLKAHGVWIGATDRLFPFTWKWHDGSTFNKSLYKWIPGNPDNDGNIFDGFPDSEDCLEMATASVKVRGLLNDYICTRPLPYICEMKDKDADVTKSTAETVTMTTNQHLVITPSTSSSPRKGKAAAWVMGVLLLLVTGTVMAIVIFILFRRKKSKKTNHYEDTLAMPRNISEHEYSEWDSSNQTNTQLPDKADCMTNIYDDPVFEYEDSKLRPETTRFGSSYCDVLAANDRVEVNRNTNTEHENGKHLFTTKAKFRNLHAQPALNDRINNGRKGTVESEYVDFDIGEGHLAPGTHNDTAVVKKGKKSMSRVRQNIINENKAITNNKANNGSLAQKPKQTHFQPVPAPRRRSRDN